MHRLALLALVVLLTGLAVPAARAAAGSEVYAITLEEAARAVFAAHPELAGDAVELPARMETREQVPVLEAGPLVRQAASSGSTETVGHVRLRCQAEACLPFYVLVHLSSSATQATPSSRQPSPRLALNREPAAAFAASAPTLRSGERASMVIDSGLLHIRVPVTCLQSGTTGSTIRVLGPARRKIYEAAIVDRSTVRGSL